MMEGAVDLRKRNGMFKRLESAAREMGDGGWARKLSLLELI